MSDFLSLQNLTLAYTKGTAAVEGLNLEVAEGELVSLLGPARPPPCGPLRGCSFHVLGRCT